MKQVCKLCLIIAILLYAIILFSCNHNTKMPTKPSVEDSVIIDNAYYYPKIDILVNQFDRKEYSAYYQQKKVYPIEDSLCYFFSRLDKGKLTNDNEFKYIAGKLLEKQYLDVRNDGMFPPESFPVYNMSIVTCTRKSSRFALDIILNGFIGEFTCIDSLVLILDKLPQMQNDPNHQKCMYLVKNNMTGGCKW